MASEGALQQTGGFDFKKLCETFSEICPDFRYHATERAQSSDFANKVLFDLGPKMRQIKQSGSSQMWRLVFSGGGSVFIYSYTFKGPINVTPCFKDTKLYLTLKQAGLLAACKLCSLLPDQHDPRDKILLTPLARAVFLPQNIPKIAVALTRLLGRSVNVAEVVKAVICSCQTDGFHLQHSQCHIAVVAIEATATDLNKHKTLRAKTLRLYEKHGKAFDDAQYTVYAQHSKLANRPPITNSVQPGTAEKHGTSQARAIDLTSVLPVINKNPDDPLSGGTLELRFLAPPVPKPKLQFTLPTPTDVQVGSTNLVGIRSVHLPAPSAIRSTPRHFSNDNLEIDSFLDYEYNDLNEHDLDWGNFGDESFY